MPATATTTRRASMWPSDYRVFPDISPRPAVGLEDLCERSAAPWERAEGALHDPDDAAEQDVPGEEGVYRLLVGGIQDRGMPPTLPGRLPGQADALKSALVQIVELQAGELVRGGRGHRVRQPVGIGQRHSDRETHVRPSQLGLQRAVDELHERVDDALRMDAHRDRVQWDAKQVMRLDELEALVHERRRVDGD